MAFEKMLEPAEGRVEKSSIALKLPDDSGEKKVGLPDDSGEAKKIPGDLERDAVDKNSKDSNARLRELPERMEPPIIIAFRCPEGCDKKEFERQLKGQERGLNSQSIAENMKNRADYEARKAETGDGRAEGSDIAQQRAREKALMQRVQSNEKKGMSYAEAKKEADVWIKTQAALHNPDQIAGGDPMKVSKMGNSNVNSSIGGQWKSRVGQLSESINAFAEGYTEDELTKIKLSVKLEVE